MPLVHVRAMPVSQAVLIGGGGTGAGGAHKTNHGLQESEGRREGGAPGDGGTLRDRRREGGRAVEHAGAAEHNPYLSGIAAELHRMTVKSASAGRKGA